MAATILYLDTIPDERIQKMTLAGIRRYAAAKGWHVVAVPVAESRPDRIPALLSEHRPVAGYIVECSDGRRDLPPRLFGKMPVVYLHAAPSLYGGRGLRVNSDNAAIAAAAFNELSVGRPEAFAAVAFAGYSGKREWSQVREEVFATLAAKSGKPFFHLPWMMETKRRRAARLVNWLSTLPRHTAIFAVNDITAVEVADAARAVHRPIPRELILIGVDNNNALCEAARPAISSLRLDHERAGFLAARQIGENAARAAWDKRQAEADARGTAPCRMPHVARLQIPSSATMVGPLMAVRRKSTGGHGRHEKFVLEAVEMIRREACNGLTAEALISRFQCSRWLFEMRFREAMGHSVLEEITSVRIEQACTYLSTTDASIAAIADFCGFGSYRSLHAIFHAKTGMSPSRFRALNRK